MAAPRLEAMRVVPVAGRDSMLMNLSGAHGPFAAETQSLQRARREQRTEAVGEAVEAREHREPQDGQLQDAHPPEAIGEGAGDPPAEGRDEQGDGGE